MTPAEPAPLWDAMHGLELWLKLRLRMFRLDGLPVLALLPLTTAIVLP